MRILFITLFLSGILGTFGQEFRPNIVSTANLLAYWKMGEGSGQWVANSATQPATKVNLLPYGEQLFASTAFWNNVGPTITDNFAANPNGVSTASRAVAASGSLKYLQWSPVTFTATPYTISVYVKSNTGGTQTFRIGYVDGGGLHVTSDQTATTSWQRFSTTFTASATSSGNVDIVMTDSANNAFDILIWGAQLETGSSATTYQLPQGDLMLGKSGQSESADAFWTTGGLGLTNGNLGYTVFASPPLLSNVTFYAVAKRSGVIPTAGYAPLIVDRFSGSKYELSTEYGGVAPYPNFSWNGSFAAGAASAVGDGAWHLYTGVYDGSAVHLYVDDNEVASTTASVSAVQTREMYLGVANFSAWFAGSIGPCAVYSVAHSGNTVRSQFSAFKNLMAGRGVALNAAQKFVAFEGDSITAGQGISGTNTAYPFSAVTPISPNPGGRVFAVSGSSLTTLNSRTNAVDLLLNPARQKNIMVVLIGRNDLAGNTNYVQFKADLATYCNTRRALGWKVIACTILPSTFAGFNATRNSANTLIRGDSSFYDALADFAGDATMGPDAAASNATYYGDGTHPTAAGQALLAPIAQAAIQSML